MTVTGENERDIKIERVRCINPNVSSGRVYQYDQCHPLIASHRKQSVMYDFLPMISKTELCHEIAKAS